MTAQGLGSSVARLHKFAVNVLQEAVLRDRLLLLYVSSCLICTSLIHWPMKLLGINVRI